MIGGGMLPYDVGDDGLWWQGSLAFKTNNQVAKI